MTTPERSNQTTLISCKSILLTLIAAASLFQSGCVLGRRSISLSVPAPTATKGAGQVSIGAITDGRRFESDPDSPSTPSVDGDVSKMSPEQLAQMIGRQRNGYGMAMGDIALSGGDNVQGKMRELVTTALSKRGYSIGSGAANSVSVRIDEFWAWFTPGMWSIGFEARVRGSFTVRKGGTSRTFSVLGAGENLGQVASDKNWQEAYERAFDDFLKKLEAELAAAGF